MRSRNLNVFGTRFLWPVLRFGRRTSCNKLTDVASLATFSFCNDVMFVFTDNLQNYTIYVVSGMRLITFSFFEEYVPKRHILL